jgi:hypothetical protein
MRERGQNQSLDMSPELLKEMDRTTFSPSIKIERRNMIPKTIKTRAQVKAWILQILQSPGSLENIDLATLLKLQRLMSRYLRTSDLLAMNLSAQRALRHINMLVLGKEVV